MQKVVTSACISLPLNSDAILVPHPTRFNPQLPTQSRAAKRLEDCGLWSAYDTAVWAFSAFVCFAPLADFIPPSDEMGYTLLLVGKR
jgi:hypothetical protein